jgi:DNA-binding response OmpR family regulator
MVESLVEDEDIVYQTCPCCNHRFPYKDPKEITRGHWRLTKENSFYNNKHVKINKTHSHLLYLLAARNVPVKAEQIGWAIGGHDVSDYISLTQVYICRIRKFLIQNNIPLPFVNIHGRGYQWTTTN